MSLTPIGPDTVVTITYVLFDAEGQAVERATAEEPLSFVHGYAQVVDGLEEGLVGCHAGDRRELTIAAEDAFGERDEDGIFEVDRSDLPNPEAVVVGDEFFAEGPDDDAIAMRVVEVRSDAVLVDTNHPLAGQRVRFEVEVVAVRAATEEEIAEAQADLEAHVAGFGHACCDEDHDHDHDHEPAPETLVQLKKKA
jgi:FKBP-type peptidyl-prolyl cis-trans isomerase SlyD